MNHTATVVVGLGFGDEGKGTIVDWLARMSPSVTVVRYNGGGQAAHNVYTDKVHHTFAHFGSGTLAGARTHLSRFMLVNPLDLEIEAEALKAFVDPYEGLTIDQDCLIVTPLHKAANRIRESSRGLHSSGEHGSCGMGIGETVDQDLRHPPNSIRARDLGDRRTLLTKLECVRKQLHFELKYAFDSLRAHEGLAAELRLLANPALCEQIASDLQIVARKLRIVDGEHLHFLALEGDLIFEGAQGVLLDEHYGFHPYTTWSNCTPANAHTLLREIEHDTVTTLGVLRAYHTRHGKGPFPTYDSQLSKKFMDSNNTTNRWQGTFRAGWFDAMLANYALDICNAYAAHVDALAITNLDRVAGAESRFCKAYVFGQQGPRFDRLGLPPKHMEAEPSAQVTTMMFAAQPLYDCETLTSENYLAKLEDMLKMPIDVVSEGPRHDQKRVRMARRSGLSLPRRKRVS